MKFKNFSGTTFIFFMNLILSANLCAQEKYSKISDRTAGRAQIIKERVSSIYERGESKYQNLYYFIVSTLEDSHGLYSLGDTKNSLYKLLILDTITYDLVCAGVTAVSQINKQVGELQRSKDAGNLEKFKRITENNLQLVSKRGLLESVHFTQTEEKIFSVAANEIIKKAERIKKIKNKREIQYLLLSSGAVGTEHIKFRLPSSIEPPLTEYFMSILIDKKWGLVINIHFQSENVKKESLLLALWNLLAYKEGLAVNNNESLESQIHYLLIQMRMADWILKNSARFGIKDRSNLIQFRKWYQDAFERLVEESFMPQYYDQLFKFKQSDQIERISFDWKIKNEIPKTANSPLSDDYIFYLMGNGSQMPPNDRLKKFLEKEKFSSGTAFDLGCGDGSNTRLLAKSGLFKNVVAIDHSQAAVRRVKRLELLEDGLKDKIRAVKSDILKYKYPAKNSPIFQKASLIVIDNVIEYLAYKKRIALLQNLKNALLKGGFIYIEYHLAGGEKFEELKSDLKIKVTENNDLITKNPFQGKQIKHFYKKGEIKAELNKSQITAETGFSVTENFVDEKNGFKVGIVVIRKH